MLNRRISLVLFLCRVESFHEVKLQRVLRCLSEAKSSNHSELSGNGKW